MYLLWHNDDLNEADEQKDEGGAGYVCSESGVYLLGVLTEREERGDKRVGLQKKHLNGL